MKTHDIVRGNVEHWLQENKKAYQWLTDEMDVSQTMIQKMLSEKGTIPAEYIEMLSKIMNVSVENLVKCDNQQRHLTVQIRGKLDNRHSKQDLKDILFDIEDYMSLKE